MKLISQPTSRPAILDQVFNCTKCGLKGKLELEDFREHRACWFYDGRGASTSCSNCGALILIQEPALALVDYPVLEGVKS